MKFNVLAVALVTATAFAAPAFASAAFDATHPGYVAARNNTQSLAQGGASGSSCSSGAAVDHNGNIIYTNGKDSCGRSQ